MVYPYKLRIFDNDKEMQNILSRLCKDRTVTISKNKNILKSMGWKLKPIRNDIFIGFDLRKYDSNVSLKNPMVHIDIVEYKEKKFKDFVFKI